jgi:uncharacterized membrane protein
MERVLDRGSTVADQQQGQKSRAQATRKGSGPRDTQAVRKNSGSRGQQASATAARGPGAGGNGAGRGRAQAGRQNGAAAGRQAGTTAGRQGRGPDARRTSAEVAAARGPWTPRWLPFAALGLSVIGLGLGIYLTIAHLVGTQILACSNNPHALIDCAAVTTSPESKLFGIFPVAELGLGFFFAMTLLNLPWAWRPTWSWLPKRLTATRPDLPSKLPVLAWRLRFAGIIVGILFILYLVYTELITLRQICLFCTYTHITTFLLFVLLVIQAAYWGDPSKATGAPAARQAAR